LLKRLTPSWTVYLIFTFKYNKKDGKNINIHFGRYFIIPFLFPKLISQLWENWHKKPFTIYLTFSDFLWYYQLIITYKEFILICVFFFLTKIGLRWVVYFDAWPVHYSSSHDIHLTRLHPVPKEYFLLFQFSLFFYFFSIIMENNPQCLSLL